MGRFIPPGIGPHPGRGKAARLLVLACAAFLAAGGGLGAQPADTIRTFHVPARSFNIPFTPTENDPRIQVLLNVSTDGRTYKYVAAAHTNERRFFFTAPADGLYYFIVQTRDPSGALSPSDLRGVPPSIKVYVDTKGPVIDELTADRAQDTGLPRIHWKINEDNLQEIRAEYRSTSSDQWQPLFLPLQADGQHAWKPAWGGELEVRMWVQDKAAQWSAMRTVRVRVADNVSGMRPPEAAGPSKVMHVSSKTFKLQYQLDLETVGPSRVKSVDIWKLHQGRGWQKCREQGIPEGPATVTVDETGRWGFRLIPRSGVGLAERDPQAGDTPDIWVEVDDKKPQVRVTRVTVIQEGDVGYLTVYWTADDTFLKAMPITILWKDPQAGEWTPIAAELPNTGSWRQRTDALKLGERYEFSLMVSAVDEAGNRGSDTWRESVKVDLKIPRIKSIEVHPGGAAGSGGQEAYGSPGMRPYTGQAGGTSSPSTLPPFGSQPTSRPPASPNTATGGGFSAPIRP